jgi:oxazoline/thiazoline synthase
MVLVHEVLMDALIHIAPSVTLLFIDDGGVVEAADGFQVTRDPSLRAVLLALTKTAHTRADLVAAVSPGVEPDAAHRAVTLLVSAGTLLELPTSISPTAAAHWSGLGVQPAEAAVAVHSHLVGVIGRGIRTRSLTAALQEWGFSSGRGTQPLRVVVALDPLDDRLREDNAAALQTGSPWFLVVPVGLGAWVGLFRPGHTACWECLATRLRHNRPARALDRPRRAKGPFIARTVADRLAAAVATFTACGEVPELEGQWSRIASAPADQVERHPLDRLPHCSACGTPLTGKSSLLIPTPPPPDFRRLVSPVTGIARDLRLLGATGGAFAAVVRHRFFDHADSLDGLMLNEQHVAGGKGWSPEEAARSAVFEAVERISGCYRPPLLLREATASELGSEALLPSEVDLFSAAQRACPSALGPPTPLTVPHDLDPHLRTRWVRAWPLGHEGSPRWFPAGAAFYGYPFEGPRFALATSNGCAAGPTPGAAAIGGLLELIERDAAAIWWYNRIPRPALDLKASNDERLIRMREAFEATGRTFDLLDITTDLGVPSVAAVSRRMAGAPGWTLGFGAAATFAEAALRAAGELAQLIPATDNPAHRNPAPWVDSATPEDNPHLVPQERIAAPSRALGPGLEPLTAALRDVGLRAYVVDQTHPLIGVPVVRVLAPGLVHFWRRLGAPRLYEVPVRMGWRPRPADESELNPLDLTL